MPSLLLRQSASMRDPSSSRAATLRSRPPSARSFVSPPARSEPHPHTVSQQRVMDETATIPTPEPQVPHKGLRLKTIIPKPFNDGSFSTVGPSSRSSVTITSPTSNPKAATASSRPASQATKRPKVLGETLRNLTPIATLAQKQVSPGQKLGPENWTPITAAKVIMSTSPPRLKIHKNRRETILPKTGATSLFGPVQSSPNQKYMDVFYDRKCNSPPLLPHPPAKALSPQTPPAKFSARNPPPKLAPGLRRTRSALSLPSRQLKRRARAVSKMVTWGPAIISAGPEVHSKSRNSREEGQREVQMNDAPQQVLTNKLGVKDCVETIKEWGKADRSKLVSLIEALKQLELDSEDRGKDGGNAKLSNDHDDEVLITTVKSLDPRVPEFQTSRIPEVEVKANKLKGLERHRPAEPDLNAFPESDCNKENAPGAPLQPLAKSRDDGACKRKKTISILDDYSSPGREVDSFDHWYGEMQLREFTKKYPLTGRRASAVRQSANIAAKIARAAENVRSVSRGSNVAAKEFRSGTRDESVLNVDRVWRIGDEREGQGVGGEARQVERENFARSKSTRPKRGNLLAMADRLGRQNAAIIQQRLEVLLLKERERKALEGMPEKKKWSMREVDCGMWLWGGNPHSRGLDCDQQ